MERAAVVLMAYGSPERLADVPAYYADIRGGRPIRPELLDDLVERYRRGAGLLFTVDTLEFLARGGRIGKASAFAGQMLKIKPILSIRDGEVLPLKRVRGNQKAFMEFVNEFSTGTRDEPGLRVGIAHADAPERAAALADMVARERPQAEVEIVTSLGSVVGTHAGPGTVGFFWFHDA